MVPYHMSGFEWNSLAQMNFGCTDGPDGTASGAGFSVSSAKKRSGDYSLLWSSANTNTATIKSSGGSYTTGQIIAHFWISNAPTTNESLIIFEDTIHYIRLNTDRTLSLINSSTVVFTTTATVPTQKWFGIKYSLSQASTYGRLYLNGVLVGSDEGMTPGAITNLSFGYTSGNWPGSSSVYIDDVASWSGTDADIPWDIRVAILFPASTNSAGSWTGGAGGAATFDAVNNRPPAGLSAETDSSQIEAAADSTFTVNLETWASKTGSVNCPFWGGMSAICHGEDITTQTKSGYATSTNPSVGGTFFDFGNDQLALGNYPSYWSWRNDAITHDATFDRSATPVLSVVRTAGGTRVASVCAMGITVAYSGVSIPATPAFPRPALTM